ncbi:GNAT family N-acetyltransferase [Clostridium sp. P21]|uniref:GNAT family N-acetyltransferase n=1 Tax=Clostridium muellerianum TaxID=2716538 RepID=A0A7Y0EGS3_9CLOT|nr:N-acetyltransferase [Clostridium muellerianum]NMM62847.1 GNAT family N-acetyltransferase [Clostridium muellerianum]
MINISEADVSETKEIKQLLNYVWSTAHGSIFSKETIKYITEKGQTYENLKKEIEDTNILFIVAKNDLKKIIGLATVKNKDKDKDVFIQRLYIHPSYQSQGIGKNILINIVNRFKNMKSIHLEVEENNDKALKFYKKCGFNIVKRNEYELKGDEFKTFLMEKLF